MDAKMRGYTLWELLLTTVIMALTAGIALPWMEQSMVRSELGAAELAWAGVLNRARQRAVIAGIPVAFCHVADEGPCGTLADSPTRLLVFEDANADGRWERSERRLWVEDLPVARKRVETRLTGSFREGGIYLPDGRAIRPGGAFLAGSIYLCSTAGGRRIVVNRTGRVRVEEHAC